MTLMHIKRSLHLWTAVVSTRYVIPASEPSREAADNVGPPHGAQLLVRVQRLPHVWFQTDTRAVQDRSKR